jgi:hypothetical protein
LLRLPCALSRCRRNAAALDGFARQIGVHYLHRALRVRRLVAAGINGRSLPRKFEVSGRVYRRDAIQLAHCAMSAPVYLAPEGTMKEARITRPIHPQHALAARFVPRRQWPNHTMQRMRASRLGQSEFERHGGWPAPLMVDVRRKRETMLAARNLEFRVRGESLTSKERLLWHVYSCSCWRRLA